MFILAKLVAVLLIISGCILILKPENINKIFDWAKEGKRIYGVAAGRIIIGWILVNVSLESHAVWLVMLLGAVAIISGIAIFVMKKDMAIEFAEKFINKPESKLKHIAAVPLVLGILLFIAL